jgi:peptidoglycan/xylan/chitin deacetylase (PgdA/CDA1 family)
MPRRWLLFALVLVLATAAPVEAASTVVQAGPGTLRQVALTFDDGWDVGACAQITSMLRAHGAVGTFFINGLYVNGAPAAWRSALRGMDVGNHTRAHLDLTRLSSADVRHQIASNEQVIEKVLRRPMLKLLRPPYGAYDSRVQRIARSLGYRRIVLWDQDTSDWMSSATVSGVIARATAGGSGSIVLMHCGPQVTVRALPAIIHSYQQRGYRLVGLGRLLGRH